VHQRGRLYSHAGQALLVTANAATWFGGSVCKTVGDTPPASYMLSHGGSFGAGMLAGMIQTFPNYHYDFRHWGDLTIQPTMNPPNDGPTLTRFTCDKYVVGLNEPVTLTLQATDPDAAKTDSPFVDYEYLFDIMINNKSVGTVTSVDGNATYTMSFDKPHVYNLVIQVADEWTYQRCGGWRTFTVAPDSRQPVRINCGETANDLYDNANQLWLYDQYYAEGTYGMTSRGAGFGEGHCPRLPSSSWCRL
jgi:hypothetical protein